MDRSQWMLELLSQRARFMHAFVSLRSEQLYTLSDENGWTLADILAHVNVWEVRVSELLPIILASDTPAVPAVNGEELNRRASADMRARGFVAVLHDLLAARQNMLHTLAEASDVAIARKRTLPSDKPFTVRHWAIQELTEHEAEHAEHVRAIRKVHGIKSAVGPKALLVAIFATSHVYLMEAAARVPIGQEATLPVTGDWTLKDVLGHIADWHFTFADAVQRVFYGQPLTQVEFSRIQQWNDEHATVRRDDSWQKVKADYDRAWHNVLAALEQASEADLTKEAAQGERGPILLYPWLYIAAHHENEHAGFLKEWFRTYDHNKLNALARSTA